MKPLDNAKIMSEQQRLWIQKLSRYGNCPQAVGSESIEHKQLRYRQLSRIFDNESEFSILDVGAGVGDYFGFLNQFFSEKQITYQGLEITNEFCKIAEEKYSDISIDTRNILIDEVELYDYVVLSGIFHQRGEVSINDWNEFMKNILLKAFQISNKGIAFNVLSNYVDYQKDGNFYVNLTELQDFIVSKLSRFYSINHAYPLFEATVFCYKPKEILKLYPQVTFKKYVKE